MDGAPPEDRGERIHPWECPDCGDEGAPTLVYHLGIYRCDECGFTVPVDEVGPPDQR